MKLLSIVFLAAASWAFTAEAFPPGRNGGWTDVSADIGVEFNGRVIAVADWSNSQQSDLITVDANNTVSVHSWRAGAHRFEETHTFDFYPERVLSAVVADMNRDGHVDLVVATDEGKLHIVYGPDRVVKDVLPRVPLHRSIPHLNVLNLFGNCALPDLVVLTANNQLTVLKNTIAGGRSCGYIGDDASFVVEESTYLIDPSAAMKVASVDFYGNCKADYLSPDGSLSSLSRTVLTVRDVPKAPPRQQFEVPSFFGAPSFGDINGDGAVDIVFPACVTPQLVHNTTEVYECHRYDAVAFIKNIVSGSVCSSDSCCEGHGSRLASVTYSAAQGYRSEGDFSLFPFGCHGQNPNPASDDKDDIGFATEEDGDRRSGEKEDAHLINTPSYPAIIRLFDYNRDTRIDLLLGTTWGPMVLTNHGGSLSCSAVDPRASREEPLPDSNATTTLIMPFPFDIAEDGTVDIITFPVVSEVKKLTAHWNGFGYEEDYFFTATMLNGVDKAGGGTYPYWGAVQPGAVHRFQWQDIDTNTRTGTVTQYATSSAHMLLLPHAHFGLGRTFSPIQNYGTGVRNGAAEHKRDWSAYLMPNSQVVVLARPIEDPSQWTLRLFLYSTGYKRIILIALPTVLALIGIPILVLRCREMQFDRAEKRQQMS